MSRTVADTLNGLPDSARVLDAGAWAGPNPRATHVADFFPWETRTGRLLLEPQPNERFGKETWFQVNFCRPGMRIPVPDKFFDFAICTHTVEDLRDPTFLIEELRRIAKAGYIETPSRLVEQTVGVVDRAARFQGYNHHKWIVDANDGLLLFDKDESLYGHPSKHCIPLRSYERAVANGMESATRYFWEGRIKYRIFEAGDIARDRAQAFRRALNISAADVLTDKALRFARRQRDKMKGANTLQPNNWREISQKYSAFDLS